MVWLISSGCPGLSKRAGLNANVSMSTNKTAAAAAAVPSIITAGNATIQSRKEW